MIKIKDYTHVIKVTFDEMKMADMAQERGMVVLNMSNTPSPIEREEYINLYICFSCYKYESHETKIVPIRIKNARNVQSQDIHEPSANRVLSSV